MCFRYSAHRPADGIIEQEEATIDSGSSKVTMAHGPTLPWTRRPHPLVLLLAVLLVPLIAFIDYVSPPEIGFSLFYAIPIVLAARWGSWTSGWVTVMLAASAWTVSEVLGTPGYSSFLVPAWNGMTRLAFFSFTLIAVRRSQVMLESAELRALSDPLTGLPNRQYLLIMLNAARARLQRYRLPLTLAYVDVDDFKLVNDLHGHHAGDRLLQRIAEVLLESTRDTDTVARMGGDEFAILLAETDSSTAKAVLDRAHAGLSGITAPSGNQVTFSIGACTFSQPFESAEAMLSEADERMYRVKRHGKNSVRIDEFG